MRQEEIRKILDGWEAYIVLKASHGWSIIIQDVMMHHRARMLKALLKAQLEEFGE